MHYSARTRLVLEIVWLCVSLCLIVIGWINYNQGSGHWYLIVLIFGGLFFIYSIASAIFHWRFHRSKASLRQTSLEK